MKQFTVNRYVLKLSWFFLSIWILAAGLLIILLAMGSPQWPFIFSGIPFFFFWIIIAARYPKSVITSDDSIAFQLPGSDRIQTFKFSELEFTSKKGYYELAVAGTKKRKAFWISTKDVPEELETLLRRLLG